MIAAPGVAARLLTVSGPASRGTSWSSECLTWMYALAGSARSARSRAARRSALLKAVADISIAGDGEAVTLDQRGFIQQTIAEPDPTVKLDRYATLIGTTQQRLAPVAKLVRQAALTETGVADVWRAMSEERLTGAARFAVHLHENRLLRKEIPAS